MTTRSVATTHQGMSVTPLLSAAAAAAAVAVVVNLVMFFVGHATGGMSTTVEVMPGMGPLTWGPVVIGSLVSPFVAAGLLYGLARLLARPLPVFYALAAVLFVAVFWGPFNVVGAPTTQVVLMELMHVVVAVPVLLWLPRALRSN